MTYPVPPKKKNRTVWIVLLAVAGLVALVCCIGGLSQLATNDEPDATPSTRPTTVQPSTKPTTKPPVTTAPPRTTAPATSAPTTEAPPIVGLKSNPKKFGQGTFVVGKDVDAGDYRSPGAEESIMTLCTWTLKAKSGSIVGIGSASSVDEPELVTLKKGQTFESSGCQAWVKR
jgi:cytoskeletal protein RodZ